MYLTNCLVVLLVCLCQEGVQAIVLPNGINANCQSVMLQIHDNLIDPKGSVTSVIVNGFDGNVLHALMRATKANPKFAFSVSYDKSSGFQLTGLNGQKNTKTSRWEVLRSPPNTTVPVTFWSGMETLVPEVRTIIFQRKECIPLQSNMIAKAYVSDNTNSSILNHTEVNLEYPNRDHSLRFAKPINIFEVSMEYANIGKQRITFKFFDEFRGYLKRETDDVEGNGSVSKPGADNVGSMDLEFNGPGTVTDFAICAQADG